MKENRHLIKDLGQQPALVENGRRQPDRRQISARWLAGTVLTGLTSCTLMGVALFAALDGREQLSLPQLQLAQIETLSIEAKESDEGKVDRIAQTLPRQTFDDRRRFDLSIMQKDGEREVIRTQPFELVRMALAEDRPEKYKYPAFNALTIFANKTSKEEIKPETNLQIYGAKIESEISLRNIDLSQDTIKNHASDTLSSDEIEKSIRASGLLLDNNILRVAALNYIDPEQFNNLQGSINLSDVPDVRIIQENVSISPRIVNEESSEGYSEDLIPFRKKQTFIDALNDANYSGEDVIKISEALSKFNGSDALNAGNVLRIGIESKPSGDHLVRASIYNGMHHEISIALNDQGHFVESTEPEMSQALKTAFEGGVPLTNVAASKLLKVYDAIYRAVLSYDMPQETAQQLINVLANDVDLQSTVSSTDMLEVFYAVPDKDNKKDAEPEIRFVSATFGDVTRKYYRFHSQDGTVDFYDSEGRSSKQFLLRKPVPNGRFTSPFGPRRHPVLGYVRMHTGVDWAAPRGSPIIAAGDGIITKASYTRGYGNHTEIRHANGYVTSYSHQNGFAANIKPGVKVRQGQIIGYVGSTGLSTGAHCHFEVVVNGTKVDPMRIRLPDNKSLKGQDLVAFKRDRDSIDSYINGQGDQKLVSVASVNDKDS
ncbi:peptidoglycan DD-metalloendopeptidase family protein [Bartonella tamiae]|uniref:M23ase beta-sheet core domain-containing protein n=1 Tax=Bartonella tamiae Th239 TaxID=1094558 RepID=J1K2B4_9HYPH|nr:peptidoglycan DD-metalloendopeptidase family protein [Bartonella tamiae]EJF91622.1 hypothetical protein ME5_00001 [Bartonella tamiae Th239]EJF92703.1 hypothetical protein MEG_01873 [Bartonella tamiae Th307]